MGKVYYKKSVPKFQKKILLRLFGIMLCAIGGIITVYIFAPLVLWQIFIAPAIAATQLTAPIPQAIVVSPATIQNLVRSQITVFGTDYDNAKNWFPGFSGSSLKTGVSLYSLSIPKIHIKDAQVSATDDDLAKHLVDLQGTCTPPDKGNCVIFGHSTLPQLFDPKNYKTIFANAHLLQVGDLFTVNVSDIVYTYKIISISIVGPEDTSVLAQTTDNSYITLITCTPPGTIWKRLIIKAVLQNL